MWRVDLCVLAQAHRHPVVGSGIPTVQPNVGVGLLAAKTLTQEHLCFLEFRYRTFVQLETQEPVHVRANLERRLLDQQVAGQVEEDTRGLIHLRGFSETSEESLNFGQGHVSQIRLDLCDRIDHGHHATKSIRTVDGQLCAHAAIIVEQSPINVLAHEGISLFQSSYHAVVESEDLMDDAVILTIQS